MKDESSISLSISKVKAYNKGRVSQARKLPLSHSQHDIDNMRCHGWAVHSSVCEWVLAGAFEQVARHKNENLLKYSLDFFN